MASKIFCWRPLLYGKKWTALAHYSRGIVFLQAVNQIPERWHDLFQIITWDDKILFCQHQVSEFRPQLRFPKEKALLSPHTHGLWRCPTCNVFVFKVWISGIYWSKNIFFAYSKLLIFSIFSKFPATKNLIFLFRKQHHLFPQLIEEPSASVIHNTHSLTATSVSPKSLMCNTKAHRLCQE